MGDRDHALAYAGRRRFLLSLCLPLVIAASFGCAAHANPDAPQMDGPAGVVSQKAFRHAVDAQRAVIDEENAKTKAGTDWAGEYSSGDGLGANLTLSLAPHAGVAATWQGCLGTYSANKGAVTPRADGSLLLDKGPNDQTGMSFPEQVVPVAWGERMYMIPENKLPAFASAVNFGDKPRKDVHGMYLMRSGDDSRKAYGVPALPPAQRMLIRGVPLEVGVISVKRLHDEYVNRLGCGFRLELDHGADDGLALGMGLRMIDGSHDDRVTLEPVTPTRVVGTMSLFGDECTKPDQRPSTRTRFTSGAYQGTQENVSS